MSDNRTDIIVLGGGFAGLTLAIQIKQNQPERSIVVLEKQRHPVQAAAHKVGESTVELGAIYLTKTLGLKKYLDQAQLPKFGLRFFFRQQVQDPLSAGLEIGGMQTFPTPTYQIDRGVFENDLAKHAESIGIEFRTGCSVRDVQFNAQEATHIVRYTAGNAPNELSSRWIVDASGRAGIIKRKLNLQKAVDHNINAAWFRLAAKIDVEDWCSDQHWRRFSPPSPRWLSTNHLMGSGYWVWIIPLISGSTSIGIVADPQIHPIENFSTFEKAMTWLEQHEPHCAAAISKHADKQQDFLRLKNFSYSCSQLFSRDRWALTGEAGVFADPFYSPGTDYIALANTYIEDLIRRDFADESFTAVASIYEKLYFSFFYNTLELYRNQYPLFGNALVMPIKMIWDFTLYWSVLAFLYAHGCFTNLAFVSDVLGEFSEIESANKRMQRFFADWHTKAARRVPKCYVDHVAVGFLNRLNSQLHDELRPAEILLRFKHNVVNLKALADYITDRVDGNGSVQPPADGLDGVPEVFDRLGL